MSQLFLSKVEIGKYQKLISDFNNSFIANISMGINEIRKNIYYHFNKEPVIGNEHPIDHPTKHTDWIKTTTISDLFYDHPKPFPASIGVIFLEYGYPVFIQNQNKLWKEWKRFTWRWTDWIKEPLALKNSHSILLSRYTIRHDLFDINDLISSRMLWQRNRLCNLRNIA